MRRRLDEAGVNILDGENTTVFDEKIDNGVVRADPGSDQTELLKVNIKSPSLHAVGATCSYDIRIPVFCEHYECDMILGAFLNIGFSVGACYLVG